MASLNTGQPMSSVATVVVATDTVAMRQHMAIPLLHAARRLRTSVGPITLTLCGVGARHRCCPGPPCQITPLKVGSRRVVVPESCRHLRHASFIRWCAHSSWVGLSHVRQRQSATTQTCFRGFATRRCKTPSMKNLSLSFQRTGPNLALKRNANSAARRPSSAGPSAHFALAVQRATLSASA